MDLWEFNMCVKEYVQMQEDEAEKELALCWQIAAFTGNAFAGKLRKLSTYQRDTKKSNAPAVSKDEFERKLAEAERMNNNGA